VTAGRVLAVPRLRGGRLVISWAAQIVAAGIMGQTLFFKFTGASEAVALFEQLGVEPWGRLGLGVIELVLVVMLLVPRAAVLGGLGTVGLMLGALGSHLAVLGIEVGGDGGTLFALAVVTLAAAATVVWARRRVLVLLLKGVAARRATRG